MQKIEEYVNKVPVAFNLADNQINITLKEKNNIEIKKFKFLDFNNNDVNAILYNKNFPTLRTTKVENNKNNLVFTLVSEDELLLTNEKSKFFLKWVIITFLVR